MPRHTFPKGHKFAKGGRRAGSGQKTKEQKALKKLQEETYVSIVKKNEARLANHAVNRAFESDGILAKFMDQLGDEKQAQPQVILNISKVEEFNWSEYQTVCIASGSVRTVETTAHNNGTEESLHPSHTNGQASLISKFTPS